MNSRILKMSVAVLRPLFLVVSMWLLIRGHNHPGGGFIGGLIAGSAMILKPLAYEMEELGEKNNKYHSFFLSAGIFLIFLSSLAGLLTSQTLLEGRWIKLGLPELGQSLKLGTPLLFDVGVYLTVIGFICLIFNSMMEEWQWK